MWSPDRYTVSAGGDTHLSTCTSHNLPGDFGYFDAEPTFTFNLSGLSGYDRLEIETRKNGRSNCDTVLMVRDSFGNWYFDDDSGSNTFSEINISPTSLAEGRVDVWVGTYGSSSCTVTLEMETW